MKKADTLKQRELHRGDPKGLVLNFLGNYSAPVQLMHSFLPGKKGKEDILQAAMRAYVISTAACLETFFRDLYFYLLRKSPSFLPQALAVGNSKISARHLHRYLAHGVSSEEFAASQVSFQNADAINQNISLFFSTPLFDQLDTFEPVCDIPSKKLGALVSLKLPSSWRSDLDRTFSFRHEFAHDANSKTQIPLTEMQSIETSALLVCQLTALLPGIRPPIIVSNRQAPAILTIDDLLSETWEIVEDEPAIVLSREVDGQN